jgi:hypothetical protein
MGQDFNFAGIPDAKKPDAAADGSGLNFDGIPDAKPGETEPPSETGSTGPGGALIDAATGFVREGARHVSDAGAYLRKTFPSLDRGPAITFKTEPQNTAEKVGGFAENAAEFLAGGEGATAATRGAGLVTRAAAQGAAAYGVGRFQGETPGQAATTGAVSAIAPVAVKALEVGAPKVLQAAKIKLARSLAAGVENFSPMTDYAVQTGRAGNSQVANAARIVHTAVDDMLDLPLQASWGKYQTMIAQNAALKGQSLEQALKGSLGSEMLPKASIVQALDDLVKNSAQHLAQVRGGQRFLTYDPALDKEVEALQETLKQYGKNISVRNLVDLKQVWDDAVYTLSMSGKVGVANDVLASTAMRTAKQRGANAIRAALDAAPSNVPGQTSIASLNEAYTDAMRLQDLATRLYKNSPGMGEKTKGIVNATTAAAGALVGHQEGGYPVAVMGATLGHVASRLITTAVESPLWHTLAPAAKDRLATAIANGDADTIARILQPIVQATTSRMVRPTRGETQ